MTNVGATPGEQESMEVMRDRKRTWWTSALAGQIGQPHPVEGADISAVLEGDVLVLKGKVPTPDDRDEIEREAEHLCGESVREIRNELEVRAQGDEVKGLLTQTLIAVYDTEEQAGFAKGYMQGHARVQEEVMQVVPASDGNGSLDTAKALIPEAYWEDAERALGAGRSLLIVTIDETEAFKIRELLDEETRSLETLVLPPVPLESVNRASLDDADGRQGIEHGLDRAEGARKRTLQRENELHGN